jgi:phosphoribosylformylglycinamidine synthase II
MSLYFKDLNIAKFSKAAAIDGTPGEKLNALLKKHKINAAEFAKIKDIMGRLPSMSELGVFSAMWSEHCSYKSSRVHLKRFPTETPDVVVGPGENAGVVRISGKLCLAFKMESHNHPSYIEPYQGAATGVGGILRDVFCMGARPIANLNALRFGRRTHERTKYLVENVVKGIGDYGNCIGVPTVGGNVSFDESYDGNCLVNAMTVGTIHEDKIFKGFASGTGNIVVYVGSATGRDGIHGATMASDSFASSENSERSTVQVGDPFTEKLLLEATLEVLEKGLVIGLQDMGAAGLTSSSFEMAGRAGNGLYMDLDQIPVRTTAMTAYELLLSESQERMLMVIEPGKWPALKEVLDRWQLASAVIGVVTDTGRVHISHNGVLEVDLPVGPITDDAPKYDRPQKARASAETNSPEFNSKTVAAIKKTGVEAFLASMLSDTGDKEKIYTQYDQHIGAKTVRGPKDQGAAVMWLRSEIADKNEPNLGVAIAASCNERYCSIDPRQGAAHAVLKSARMIAATGGRPIAITDCLNYGNPEDPEVMWEFSQGVDGISDACKNLGIAVVSGNVSLYNQTDGVSIKPTPMIGMVGKVNDVTKAPSGTAEANLKVLLLQPKNAAPAFGGSLAAKLTRTSGLSAVPAINWKAEVEAIGFMRKVISEGSVKAARDVGDGGLATTMAKMLLPQQLGMKLSLGNSEKNSDLSNYFGEVAGSYILLCSSEAAAKILVSGKELKECQLLEIGTTNTQATFDFGSWSAPVKQLTSAFERSLP